MGDGWMNHRIQQLNSDINMESYTIQQHQQDRITLVNTLSSLQVQKQHEASELQEMQSSKVKVLLLLLLLSSSISNPKILEELVATQKEVTSLRTSIQALQEEKRTASKEVERVCLLVRESILIQ